jgi:hypothetical protein
MSNLRDGKTRLEKALTPAYDKLDINEYGHIVIGAAVIRDNIEALAEISNDTVKLLDEAVRCLKELRSAPMTAYQEDNLAKAVTKLCEARDLNS